VIDDTASRKIRESATSFFVFPVLYLSRRKKGEANKKRKGKEICAIDVTARDINSERNCEDITSQIMD